jgi:hypothetical protein
VASDLILTVVFLVFSLTAAWARHRADDLSHSPADALGWVVWTQLTWSCVAVAITALLAWVFT